mmetsp:Transcript_6900/g.21565  ORF Transcript_6900/g.21565 Transcript_6900/m.21565 type:complete len:94 (-) Transcript_6900:1052-1333(-)
MDGSAPRAKNVVGPLSAHTADVNRNARIVEGRQFVRMVECDLVVKSVVVHPFVRMAGSVQFAKNVAALPFVRTVSVNLSAKTAVVLLFVNMGD